MCFNSYLHFASGDLSSSHDFWMRYSALAPIRVIIVNSLVLLKSFSTLTEHSHKIHSFTHCHIVTFSLSTFYLAFTYVSAFSIFPKDTSAWTLQQPGIEPPTLKLMMIFLLKLMNHLKHRTQKVWNDTVIADIGSGWGVCFPASCQNNVKLIIKMYIVYIVQQQASWSLADWCHRCYH